jgi:CRISPR/Cas system-associated exonuclease Cas4 (RecB family)
MTDIRQLLLDVLRQRDEARPRSNQTEIGPSELGSCSRKVWYRINGYEKTNDSTLKLAAVMGTAIHASIEDALEAADPTGTRFVVESEVAWNGMKAHIDLWIPEIGAVVDWKTVKVKNLNYFPSQQQRWQVHTYGFLMEQNGHKVNTVSLVAIARDGDERDVKVHTEPYSSEIAMEALGWLEAIKQSKTAPDPEKDPSFCRNYCDFYDETGEIGCKGRGKAERLATTIIDDAAVDANALHYLQLNNQISELTEKRDGLKETFEGITGETFSGIDISWSTVKARTSIDEKQVEQLLGFVPRVQTGKDTVRLNIKQRGN